MKPIKSENLIKLTYETNLIELELDKINSIEDLYSVMLPITLTL